jgi:hypothetical protein
MTIPNFAPFLACAGNDIARWSNPSIVCNMHTEGGCSVEKVREHAPILFEGYRCNNHKQS